MARYLTAQVWWSAAALVTLYAAYIIKERRDRATARRNLATAHGCRPVKEFERSRFLFGLDCINLRNIDSPNLFDEIHDNCLKYNNTFHNELCGFDMLETNEPENIKAILATSFKDFSLSWRQKAMTKFLGNGIFVTDGEQWRHSRALLRPQFARSHIDDLPTFERHVSRLLEQLPDDGSTIDLESHFFKLTLDATTEFLLGRSTNSLAPEKLKSDADVRFAIAINDALDGTGNPLRHGLKWAFLPDLKFNRSIIHVRGVIDELVSAARASYLSGARAAEMDESGQYNVLSAVAAESANLPQIRDDLINLLLAGRDTTATLLTNVLCVITKRPDIMATLRASISHLHNSPPTYAQLKDLSYIRHCLDESLRLMPPVPSNVRIATNDVVLPLGGGADGKAPIFVKTGTFVLYHIYSTHHRGDIYGEDVGEFVPERWQKTRPGWGYLPFNGGPRVCLGRESFFPTRSSLLGDRVTQAELTP